MGSTGLTRVRLRPQISSKEFTPRQTQRMWNMYIFWLNQTVRYEVKTLDLQFPIQPKHKKPFKFKSLGAKQSKNKNKTKTSTRFLLLSTLLTEEGILFKSDQVLIQIKNADSWRIQMLAKLNNKKLSNHTICCDNLKPYWKLVKIIKI